MLPHPAMFKPNQSIVRNRAANQTHSVRLAFYDVYVSCMWFRVCKMPVSPTFAVIVIGLSSACSFLASSGGYEACKLDVAAPDAAGLLQGVSQTIGNSAGIFAVPVSDSGLRASMDALSALRVY